MISFYTYGFLNSIILFYLQTSEPFLKLGPKTQSDVPAYHAI